ncbi:MAG: nucleotidyltransferase family protein [Oscillospiraceae bacterium]
MAKPKHWTQARMRRLLVWAYLGLTQTDRPGQPAYLRVLGFNTRGQEVLRQMKERSSLPILTKPAHARRQLEGESSCLNWRPGVPTCTTYALKPSQGRDESGPPARCGCERRSDEKQDNLDQVGGRVGSASGVGGAV